MMMERHRIVLKGKEYEYELSLKKIKSIYVRVENGMIKVSAPLYTPLKVIEDLLYKHQDQLIERIENFVPNVEYKDGGSLLLFNQLYTIKLRDVGVRKCAIHDYSLYVYHKDIQSCVESYMKQILMDYLEERITYYLTYQFNLPEPRIIIKKYKSRWGSCFYEDNKVTFNLSLVHLDKELIDYVIVHELCHFIEPNHSSRFYREVEKRMPDYKERVQRLKEAHP